MTVTVHAFVFDCTNASRLANFWAKALGRAVDPGATADFASIGVEGATGPSPSWMFVKVPETKTVKNRLHCDLAAADLDDEVGRLVDLGAIRQAGFDEDGSRWVTLLDPEGNEFDVVAHSS